MTTYWTARSIRSTVRSSTAGGRAAAAGGTGGRGGGGAGVGAAFEPRVAVGVEQAAAVCGQPQVLVGYAGVDGAGDGEQPVPGGGALAEDGAEAVGLL